MKSTGSKAARYLVTGSLAAVVDTLTFALLLPLGLGLAVTATLSFLAASICNYCTSAGFVFDSQRSIAGYFRFLAGAVIGLGLNVGLTVWFAGLLPGLVPASLAARLPDLAIIAKLLAIVIATVFNFAINLLVVFKPRR
ncbi:GtrA family protein [Polymorphobacter sp.]|uniref:GtrA family protein n=1 Tax=Polymorphobacter sp. TaxID=1909290 RepID=UPI003F716399